MGIVFQDEDERRAWVAAWCAAYPVEHRQCAWASEAADQMLADIRARYPQPQTVAQTDDGEALPKGRAEAMAAAEKWLRDNGR